MFVNCKCCIYFNCYFRLLFSQKYVNIGSNIIMRGDFMTNETFKIKSGYVLREIEGEFLAIPFAPELNSANIIILNPVSGLLWEKLQSECTLPQLVEAVIGNFKIDAETAQGDIEEFLQVLKENNMLE